jgi:hypothetical protein
MAKVYLANNSWATVLVLAAIVILFGVLASGMFRRYYEFTLEGKETTATVTKVYGSYVRSGKTGPTWYEYMVRYDEGFVKIDLKTRYEEGNTLRIIYIPGTGKVVAENEFSHAPVFFAFVLLSFVVMLVVAAISATRGRIGKAQRTLAQS